MTTSSFNKNIIIKDPEAVGKLVEALLSEDVMPIDKELASAEAMARDEETAKHCLYCLSPENHNESENEQNQKKDTETIWKGHTVSY